VRGVALLAGRKLVEVYTSTTSSGLLLPQIEEGLRHENWRIRQCSIELLGYLLSQATDLNTRP
jgi:hypothetical protein